MLDDMDDLFSMGGGGTASGGDGGEASRAGFGSEGLVHACTFGGASSAHTQFGRILTSAHTSLRTRVVRPLVVVSLTDHGPRCPCMPMPTKPALPYLEPRPLSGTYMQAPRFPAPAAALDLTHTTPAHRAGCRAHCSPAANQAALLSGRF